MNISTGNFTTESSTHSVFVEESLRICLFLLNSVVGLPTHSYFIWLIVSGRGSGFALEFFNLNLSVCEIGNCLNCLIYTLYIYFPSVLIITRFLVGLVFTGRPLFQCLICVERYLAVVHPVTFLKYKPLRYRLICCVFAWIITLSSCLCSLLTDNSNTHLLVLQFLLALPIQLFCLVAVLRALKQSGPGDRRREGENHKKRRAFTVILITTVTMTIMYLPFAITGIVTVLTNQHIYLLWGTGLICYILAGFVQPALYLHRARKLSCLCAWQ